MTGTELIVDTARPSLLTTGPSLPTRELVAESLGLRVGHAEGTLPLSLNEVLLGRPEGSTAKAGRVRPFLAGGARFWWLGPAETGSTALDAAVGLDGHRVGWPSRAVEAGVVHALELIAARPWAMALVTTYVTTFALATRPDGEKGQITSCSLPDFPLCVFLSPRAFVHIPPLSVSRTESARLAAENIYHEAVHQSVNHSLLTRDLLAPSYSSATSPKIPIYWRSGAGNAARNREWELDRVLHAAAVYCHLLRWRHAELTDPTSGVEHRSFVARAAAESIGALTTLCDALVEHIGHFTPEGALTVGRIVEASNNRGALLRLTLDSLETGLLEV
ncbi:hypothetical protein [Allokutzneria oryzae]|uniref:HEXXH motif domain-containing protein n=1 Tax=Allokutzneria oryzae TaxID=1378989 RepID=A0ABV6A8A5_9PSEU